MRLHLQPENSKTCGHCVVAMLAGCSPADVADSLLHDRATTWVELYSVLFANGVVCEPMLSAAFSHGDIPPTAVLRLPGPNAKLGHWAAVQGGTVYDPAVGLYPVDELRFMHAPDHHVIKYAGVTSM